MIAILILISFYQIKFSIDENTLIILPPVLFKIVKEAVK